MSKTLQNVTPTGIDTWEVGFFSRDAQGNVLSQPLRGIRVNDGTWLRARDLMKLIEDWKNEHD